MKAHFHTGSRQWCVLSGLLGVVLGTALALMRFLRSDTARQLIAEHGYGF